ncbi:MAG TPA: hypothetical protein VI643_03905 [Planctomycetota bacterium]|nr:hypothetical protein [Planctomycetota bacterium]
MSGEEKRVDPLMGQLLRVSGGVDETQGAALEQEAWEFFEAGGVLDWRTWERLDFASRQAFGRAHYRQAQAFAELLADAINEPEETRIQQTEEDLKNLEASQALDAFLAVSPTQEATQQ